MNKNGAANNIMQNFKKLCNIDLLKEKFTTFDKKSKFQYY